VAGSFRFQSQVEGPPAALVDRYFLPMRAVASTWVYLARYLPIEITSWWRDPDHNAEEGGAEYSQHLFGTAMDAKSPGMSRAQLLPLVQRVAAAFGASAPAEGSRTSGSSVHVQGLPAGEVQRVLRSDPGMLVRAEAFVGPPRGVVAAAVARAAQPARSRYEV
jgi:hypothetical protein